MSFANIHTEEELLKEIEQEDDWMEGLDLISFDDVMEDIDEESDILYEEDKEYWVH